ncbi:SlyX family protein [Idiomarina xiamenensis]|uniref:Protein SlyX homolog n=1 Tax=Idiomarina xiamenensis 10-D-4 TaxID=740709 RepID=K2JLZ2_9GAMM|nr:SlyX family protein [Idiomarina xiamenensis]EKE84526.1 hypothetical protein A10D4_05642 [Idiomarina xiamenensis 10-D-4]
MTDKALIQRMDKLESQLAFQDDVIDSLNHLVTQQSRELQQLQQQLKLVASKVKNLRDDDALPNADASQEPPPPHY